MCFVISAKPDQVRGKNAVRWVNHDRGVARRCADSSDKYVAMAEAIACKFIISKLAKWNRIPINPALA